MASTQLMVGRRSPKKPYPFVLENLKKVQFPYVHCKEAKFSETYLQIGITSQQ